MPRSGGLDDYDILYKIGSGSYGTCKKIRRKRDGKMLVWKEMEYGTMNETEKQMLVSEVNLLRELKHPYIVRYYDRIIDRTNTTLYIVMEYCEGGDLASLIGQHRKDASYIAEDFVWKMFAQITAALKECHRRKGGQAVLHRDLKPANVFLDRSRNVKLGDFGLARVLHHETSFAKTFVGTPYYMSPEQMNFMKYNEKSDIWSLGCLIYEVCALHPPFIASTQKELAVKIRAGRFTRIPSHYLDDLMMLISSMLRVNEDRRPTIETVMEHPQIMNRLSELQSPSSKTRSPDFAQKDASLKKQEQALNEREKVLVAREKEIDHRERELSAREKEVEIREKLAEERLARAEHTILEARENRYRPRNLLGTPIESRDQLHSCLHRIKLSEVTPKKSVHFDEKKFGRDENRPRRERLFLDQKPEQLDVKERLHRAKLRAIDLRRAEIESKQKTKVLLGIR